jgi:hypothetical protein
LRTGGLGACAWIDALAAMHERAVSAATAARLPKTTASPRGQLTPYSSLTACFQGKVRLGARLKPSRYVRYGDSDVILSLDHRHPADSRARWLIAAYNTDA